MPKIKFTQSRDVKDAAGKVKKSFKQGETYDVSREIAYRWIRRQVAVAVEETPKEKPKPKTKSKPVEKKEDEPTTFEKHTPPVNKA